MFRRAPYPADWRTPSDSTGVVDTIRLGVLAISAIALVLAGSAILFGAAEGPDATLNATANGSHVTLEHVEGAALDANNVTVSFQDQSIGNVSLEAFAGISGQFEPGDQGTFPYNRSRSIVAINVVHDPSERVLLIWDESTGK